MVQFKKLLVRTFKRWNRYIHVRVAVKCTNGRVRQKVSLEFKKWTRRDKSAFPALHHEYL